MAQQGVGNGNYVTWRELNLSLEPLKGKLDEISSGVDLLLEERARSEGARHQRRRLRETGGGFVALVSGLVGVLATLLALGHW